MPSLPQVLHEATRRSATEIIIESGQAPMVRTEAGSVSIGELLSESELFDALAQVLGPDQQAELAVGNVVSFELEVENGAWSLVTEPSADGIVVRGKSLGGTSSDAEGAGPALDLPKLDPVELERQKPVPATSPSLSTTPKRRSTQWDIGVPAAPDPGARSAPPSTPSWSRRLEAPEESDFEIRTPTGEQPANLIDAHDAHADDDDGGDDLPELLAPPPSEQAWDDEVETVPVPAPAQHVSQTRLAANPPATAATLESFAASVQPGTLCLVQGEGAGEVLAMALDGGDYALIDDTEPGGVLRAAAEFEPGGRFFVAVDDPSACLGWILRRLEEGARVVVQTRARTAPGARRILLGTDASERAEAWLDAHNLLWFASDADGWTRHPF
ncbi:MAG: hypothetical protein AAGA54_04040 [Myxococcota bacterium]